MTYEYEGKFISLLDRLDEEERDFIFRGIDDELKEVYAKARAFDEIVKLRDNYYTYSKNDNEGLIALLDAKPFGREVSHFINKKEYMEDK